MKKLNFLLVLLAATITVYTQDTCTIEFDVEELGVKELTECNLNMRIALGDANYYYDGSWYVFPYSDTLISDKCFSIISFEIAYENRDSTGTIYYLGLKDQDLKYKDSIVVNEPYTDDTANIILPQTWDSINKLCIMYPFHWLPSKSFDVFVYGIKLKTNDSITVDRSSMLHQEKQIQIFPNPFKKEYNVYFKKPIKFKNFSYIITDIKGTQIKYKKEIVNNQQLLININEEEKSNIFLNTFYIDDSIEIVKSIRTK
jgi:hypothetical protein